MSRRSLLFGAGSVAAAVVTAACGTPKSSSTTAADADQAATDAPGSQGASAAPATTVPPDPVVESLRTEHVSVVATASADTVVAFAGPVGRSEVARFDRFDPTYDGIDGERVAQVFLVTDVVGDRLEVLLPVRPNGARGWIERGAVQLSEHRYAIEVALGAHRLVATDDGTPILDVPIAVGTADTPTPGGTFYLVALQQPPDPTTVYGTYAYALSGYSDTLTRFNGGEGVIGIHGTNDPSVIGSDVSHGCIRLRNEDIEQLVAVLPLGTPVTIVA